MLAAALLLAGCGNDPAAPDTEPDGYFGVTDVDVGDRTIPCVTWKSGYAGGVSCDWSAGR